MQYKSLYFSPYEGFWMSLLIYIQSHRIVQKS